MNVFRKLYIRTPIYDWLRENRLKKAHTVWLKNGRKLPPSHVSKQNVLKNICSEYNLQVFIETGTFFGDMLQALKTHFHTLYSIELSRELFDHGKLRFRKDKHIHLIFGDSGTELKHVIDTLNSPALFWLDGHYSGGVTSKGDIETPILNELNHILSNYSYNHVIVIDDARCFGKSPGYPTINQLRTFVLKKNKHVRIEFENDGIQILPAG